MGDAGVLPGEEREGGGEDERPKVLGGLKLPRVRGGGRMWNPSGTTRSLATCQPPVDDEQDAPIRPAPNGVGEVLERQR